MEGFPPDVDRPVFDTAGVQGSILDFCALSAVLRPLVWRGKRDCVSSPWDADKNISVKDPSAVSPAVFAK